jgi:hypothetical protein
MSPIFVEQLETVKKEMNLERNDFKDEFKSDDN